MARDGGGDAGPRWNAKTRLVAAVDAVDTVDAVDAVDAFAERQKRSVHGNCIQQEEPKAEDVGIWSG